MTSPEKPSPCVLIVDQDYAFRMRLSSALRRAGYWPVCVNNGQEALDYLLNRPSSVAVMIFNLVLPIMDGWRLREVQAAHPRLRHIPAIAVAGELVDQEALSSLEVDAFFPKTVDRGLLLLAIERLWARNAKTQPYAGSGTYNRVGA